VRNGLLAGSLVGLSRNRKWGFIALLLSSVLGIVRRSLLLAAPLDLSHFDVTATSVWLAQSGADWMFRLVLLAVLADALRESK
jgi:hypothetical protein